jgi:hypothetical protein
MWEQRHLFLICEYRILPNTVLCFLRQDASEKTDCKLFADVEINRL